jgi:hypothetical protein
MKAWHFCRNDMKLGYKDGRVIRTGRTYKVNCEPILCRQGLHASKRLTDALKYAAGDVLCHVSLGGKIVRGDDKVVATERTVLCVRNVEHILHEFACLCAERAMKKTGVTDKRSWAAIEVKRQWLAGLATDKQLSVAWYAARSAAWDAAWYAAWYAARSAARYAAWYAAWYAARSAARSAAEKRWQERQLRQLVKGKMHT